ncbi:hypothetical protein BY996DRAFT_6454830 [Phakopsora pachyrhizi]|nr:hypothetical protein BY996DRAFT_6454830 [Phakopsora pachyrhizi]
MIGDVLTISKDFKQPLITHKPSVAGLKILPAYPASSVLQVFEGHLILKETQKLPSLGLDIWH